MTNPFGQRAEVSNVFALPDEDIPPDIPPPDDAEPSRCQFDGCSNSVVKPARGRTPKYCPDHRKQTGTSSGRRSAGWSAADDIERILNRYFTGLAFTVTLVNPTDGSIIAEGSEAVVHELVELGRQDKTWRKYLEMLAKPGKYGPLTIASATIIIPIMANHGLLPQFMIGTRKRETTEGGE